MNKHIKLIYDFMATNNLTQHEMAQRLEITPASLSRWLTDTNGITKKNQKRVEFICGSSPTFTITKKLLNTIDELSEEDQWKAYDWITKNLK